MAGLKLSRSGHRITGFSLMSLAVNRLSKTRDKVGCIKLQSDLHCLQRDYSTEASTKPKLLERTHFVTTTFRIRLNKTKSNLTTSESYVIHFPAKVA